MKTPDTALRFIEESCQAWPELGIDICFIAASARMTRTGHGSYIKIIAYPALGSLLLFAAFPT